MPSDISMYNFSFIKHNKTECSTSPFVSGDNESLNADTTISECSFRSSPAVTPMVPCDSSPEARKSAPLNYRPPTTPYSHYKLAKQEACRQKTVNMGLVDLNAQSLPDVSKSNYKSSTQDAMTYKSSTQDVMNYKSSTQDVSQTSTQPLNCKSSMPNVNLNYTQSSPPQVCFRVASPDQSVGGKSSLPLLPHPPPPSLKSVMRAKSDQSTVVDKPLPELPIQEKRKSDSDLRPQSVTFADDPCGVSKLPPCRTSDHSLTGRKSQSGHKTRLTISFRGSNAPTQFRLRLGR